jgi:tetratricopeptide (TPR) repeat protein
MSQLVREELERQNRGSLLHRFFNHPVVLVLLLGVCVGILIWTFWPAGEQQLYDRGAELMASERLADLEKGWREYLEPLNARFPNHPYQEEVARFKQKLDAARSPTPSEAQRFFQQGEQLRHEGQYQKARKVWSELIAVFAESDTERDWVRRAERAVSELDKTIHSKDRWTSVQPALQRAAALSRAGKNADAERIWSSLEDLYRDDPGATAILSEVRQERSRAKKSHE